MGAPHLAFRENNFDLIRLLAALQVVVIHGLEHLAIPADGLLAWREILGVLPGVPIFFVISGFLVSASLERSTSTVSYAKNRFLRIYPGLWVCFLVTVLSILFLYRPHVPLGQWIPWLLAQLTIGQFYNPEFLRGYGVGVVNGSLWTIPVELQFYLLLPAVYYLFRRIRWKARVVVFLFLVLIGINQCYCALLAGGVRGIGVKLFGATVIPYLYLFLIGVMLQRHRDFVARYCANKAGYWLVAYLALTLIAKQFGVPSLSGNRINPVSAFLLGILVISFAYSYTDRLKNILRGCDISYGVYIYHMVIFNAFVYLGAVQHVAFLALGVSMTLVVAFLSWTFVEKPALRLKGYSVKIVTNDRLAETLEL